MEGLGLLWGRDRDGSLECVSEVRWGARSRSSAQPMKSLPRSRSQNHREMHGVVSMFCFRSTGAAAPRYSNRLRLVFESACSLGPSTG